MAVLIAGAFAPMSSAASPSPASLPDPGSAADLAWRADVASLTTAFPDDFGGVWYEAESRQFRVYTTQSSQTAHARLASIATSDLAADLSSRVEFVESPYSYSDLLRAQATLTREIQSGEAPFPGIQGWGPDDETGKFRLSVFGYKPTADQLAKLEENLGASVVLVHDAGETVPDAGRQSDTQPYYGGGRLNTPTGICTTGVGVVRNGAKRLLTAGHCGTGTMKTGAGVTIGTVTERTFGNSSIDAELVSAPAVAGRIFIGSATSAESLAVKQVRPFGAGDQGTVCISGSVTGEKCGGSVTAITQTRSYGGQVVCCITEINNTFSMATGGDSGAPSYIKMSGGVPIGGIHVAAQTGSNIRYEMQIQHIISKYPMSVQTG
ncbi:hypothetical protein [Nakamurella aerolata]|uniref:Serine protease n=1 Tax=Nakamurella aerolata TaxID=1656892 RepID=A0A849A7R5_9ACTN|nr:hypothetical protein [Nakamurella aerolata]NNG35533.1 hypothetical protein [Nakamurella aerolata]